VLADVNNVGNTFATLADDSVSHVGDELSQGPLNEADNREEPGQHSVASIQNRLVPFSCRVAAYLYCILR